MLSFSLPRPLRYLAALLVLCCIAFLAIVNAGWADGNRARNAAGRACTAHVRSRTLCAKRHRRPARVDARTTRLHRTHRSRHGHTPPPASSGSPSGGSAPSGGAGSGSSSGGPSTSGGSGSSPASSGPQSSAGSGPTPTVPIETIPPILESPQPTPSPAPSPAAFQPGIDSGTNMTLDVQGSALLGAKLVRIEFPIATAPAQMESVIAGYAARGIRVAPLASFYGTLPTPAEARNLAGWAATYGPGGTFWAHRSDGQLAIQSIEFGNETSYGYQYGDGAGAASYRERAENYARRLREATEAISATGIHVGLLAQADDWTGDWVDGMYAAVPNLADYVAGWTIHPYHNWVGRLEDLLEQTAAHGAPTTIPIDITEWGLPNDNGNCLTESSCPSYGQAAATLRGAVAEMRKLLAGRLGMLVLYQVRDQRNSNVSTDSEYYYGCLQHELQPKGEFTTAVQELLASS